MLSDTALMWACYDMPHVPLHDATTLPQMPLGADTPEHVIAFQARAALARTRQRHTATLARLNATRNRPQIHRIAQEESRHHA